MTKLPKTDAEVEQELELNFDAVAALGPFGLRARELKVLYTTADEISPEVMVEIGSCHGVSSVVLSAIAKKYGGVLYCIEPNPRVQLSANLQKFGLLEAVRIIKAASPNVDVKALGIKVISYLLIDGDHSLESILADYRFWAPLVKLGGRIAFHDYYSHREVRQALKQLQEEGEQLEQIVIGGVEADIEPGLIVFQKL